MRYLFLLALLLAASCNLERDPLTTTATSDPPNIVLLIVDDLTYQAVRAFGNPDVQTPNIDRLVAGGTTFTHAYNMGGWNGAICAASRAMLISGRSLWRANDFRQNWRQGEELDKTWPELMEARGYDTYMTGKWHVDARADSIFQQAVHIRPGMPKDAWAHPQRYPQMAGRSRDRHVDMPFGYARPKDENDNSWSPSDTSLLGFWEGGKHWSEVLKDDALSFIDEAKARDQPFFMYLSFNAPHDPRQAPPEYVALYEVDDLSLPGNWAPQHPFKDSIGNGPGLRDEALAPFPRTEYAVKKHLQEYYAIITHLDAQIGAILEAFRASGKMDNTYIFFTADHGLAVGRHGLIGKQSQYEHSIRVPFVVMGPDIPAGKQIDADIYLQDVMPTSLALAGIEPPDYVEFANLLPLIRGEAKESPYPAIYGAYINWQRMIRKDGFKLIVYPRAGEVELFNLQEDPLEQNDLSDHPEFAGRLKTMFDELMVLQKEMDDKLDITPLYQQTMARVTAG